jgi:hypothetical protein
LITVTSAFATTAPEVSVTVPEMVPVAAVWAEDGIAADTAKSAAADRVKRHFLAEKLLMNNWLLEIRPGKTGCGKRKDPHLPSQLCVAAEMGSDTA